MVVRDGKSHFQVDDGQYVLGLDVSVEDGVLRVVERQRAAPTRMRRRRSDEDWFEKAWSSKRRRSARGAARRTSARSRDDPQNVAAWINWGRLLHEQGGKSEAERSIARARAVRAGPAADVQSRRACSRTWAGTSAALEAYQAALGEDPTLADCHYNLARLYESLGKPQHAIRHLGQYRRLVLSDHG